MREHSEESGQEDTTEQREDDPWIRDAERVAIRTLTGATSSRSVGAELETLDAIFTALSQPGPRYVLMYLLRSEGDITMTELVDYVMERAQTMDPDEEFRRRVTTQLTHTHLPALVEEDLLNYNMERQLISPTAKTSLVEPYLKLAFAQQDRLAENSSE